MTRFACGSWLHRTAFALVIAFSLAACGGGDGEGQPDQPPSTGQPNDVPPPSGPVSGNAPPSITGNAPTTAVAGKTYSFQPQASDPDGDTLSFTIANKPSWARFDASTGLLSGTPTEGDVGEYADIEIAATDGNEVVALPRFTITVAAAGTGDGPGDNPGNDPGTHSVTLAWDAPEQNTDGSPLTDLQGYKLYYGTASRSYSDSIVIDNPGVTRYVVDTLSPGTYYFALTAFNSKGAESDYSSEVSATLQ